jgi:hypothetical protein
MAHGAFLAEADATLSKGEGREACPADVLAWVRVAAQFWVAAGEDYDVLGVDPLSAAFSFVYMFLGLCRFLCMFLPE